MVVLGKTNLSEWANIRDEHSTSGWSAHGGLTRNPYALNRTAWGSSSGSGAAVAARLARVRGRHRDQRLDHRPRPLLRARRAEADGRAACRPTGVVPISCSQDAPGPMTLTVADAAALLDVLAGTEYRRRRSRPGCAAAGSAYPVTCGATARPPTPPPSGRWRCCPAAGAVIVDDLALPALKDVDDDARAEPDADRARGRPGAGTSRRATSGALAGRRRRVQPGARRRGDAVVRAVACSSGRTETDGVSSPAYLRRPSTRAPRSGSPSSTGPSASTTSTRWSPRPWRPPRPIDLVNGDHGSGGGASDSSALAGAPILTVPLELAHGLPVAVSLWGARGSEQPAPARPRAGGRPRCAHRAAARADVPGMGVTRAGLRLA